MSDDNDIDEEFDEDTEDWDPIAELLFDITEHFGLEADIEYEERKDHVRYHIEGPDMGVLIGRRTLARSWLTIEWSWMWKVIAIAGRSSLWIRPNAMHRK